MILTARIARHAAALLAAVLWSAAVPAQALKLGPAKDPAPVAVPDPAALKPGWWDYLAPDKPGIGDRTSALLAEAGRRAATLPAGDAGAAALALDRLRTSLSALPAMLAASPAPFPELPPEKESYTTTEVLQLDREARDLQDDLDERRSAISVAQRAVRDATRRNDSAFATYLAAGSASPGRALTGLQIMANRAEVAVTEAELDLRQAEAEALGQRGTAVRSRRDRAAARIVPDPGRQPAEIRALIARNAARLETQRSEILRTRAQRSELAARPGAAKMELALADMRIVVATVEESLLATRIALYETELDWLSLGEAADMDATGLRALRARLEERRLRLNASDGEIAEWVAEIERLLTISVRPRDGATPADGDMGDAMMDLGRKAISRLARLRSLQEDARFALGVTLDSLAAASGLRGWLETQLFRRASALASEADAMLSTSLFRIGDAPVTAYGLLRVLLIMVIAVALSRLMRHLLQRFASRRHAGAGVYTVGRLLHYVLIAAGLMIGLSSIGLDFSRLALVAGALSIGIGFGLQSVVNNFVSGLMILFEQSMKIGDVVELDSGVRGVVREISVRSTLIGTSDGVDIIVPNSEFVAGKVINYTLREPYHRIHVPFGVAYSSDKDKVRAVVVEAARAVPFTHLRQDRQPDVWLVRFGDNSLDFELVVWIDPTAVNRPGAVMATYLWEIESALRRNGIEIPFPQRDVHLRVSRDELAGALESPPPAGR